MLKIVAGQFDFHCSESRAADNIAGYKGKPSSEDCKLPQGRTGTYRMLSPFDPDSSLGNRPAGVVGWSSLGLHINCRLCLPPHCFLVAAAGSVLGRPLLKDFVRAREETSSIAGALYEPAP
jgi:hypothetical protein